MLRFAWVIFCGVLWVVSMYVLDVRNGKKYPLIKASMTMLLMAIAFIAALVGNVNLNGGIPPAEQQQEANKDAGGITSLSGFQRRAICDAVTGPGRTKQIYEKLVSDNRKLGSDVSELERYMATLDECTEEEIAKACKTYKLTRNEVRQIVGIAWVSKEPPASGDIVEPESNR
jgi:hypothetical protein